MSKDLYVRNLAPETSEEELRTLFSVCGKVAYIHMVRDPKGAFLGSAYVKMASEAEAKDARASLDGAWVNHKLIEVQVALPQKPKGSPSAVKPAAERGRSGRGKRPPGETPRKQPKKR